MSYEGDRHPHIGAPAGVLESTPVGAESVDSDEGDVLLDSLENIDSFYDSVADQVEEMLAEAGAEQDGVENRELEQLLLKLSQNLNAIKQKIEDGYNPSELDQLHIQESYENIMNQADAMVEASAEESFDPETYVHEQFAEHKGLKHSETTPVILLLSQYKEAASRDDLESAESISEQIRGYVDELVGNDKIKEEGFGIDLLSQKEGVKLTPENLDDSEETVTVYAEAKQDEVVQLEQLSDDDVSEIELTSPEKGSGQGIFDAVPNERTEARQVEKEKAARAELIKNEVQGIEGFKSSGFFSQSPYEKLASENCETVVLGFDSSYVDSFERSRFVKDRGVDQLALEIWLTLIKDSGIDTTERTFKSVADEIVELQIDGRNTQST